MAGKIVVCDEGGGDGSFLAGGEGVGYLALLETPRILPSFLQSVYREIKQMNSEPT